VRFRAAAVRGGTDEAGGATSSCSKSRRLQVGIHSKLCVPSGREVWCGDGAMQGGKSRGEGSPPRSSRPDIGVAWM